MSLNHEKLQWTEWGPICSHSYFKYLSIYLDSPSAADQDEADEKSKQRIQASGCGCPWGGTCGGSCGLTCGRFFQTYLLRLSCFLHISSDEKSVQWFSKNICIIAQIDPGTHLLGRTGFIESNNGRDTTDNIKLIHQAVSLLLVLLFPALRLPQL